MANLLTTFTPNYSTASYISSKYQGLQGWVASVLVFVAAFLTCNSSDAQVLRGDLEGPVKASSSALSSGEDGAWLQVSNESFDFGPEIVGFPMLRTVAVVTNIGNRRVPLTMRLVGSSSYSFAGSDNCKNSLAAGASCNIRVNYAPRAASAPANEETTLLIQSVSKGSNWGYGVPLTGISGVMPAGIVAPTPNSLVAQYHLAIPFPGSWSVSFGETADYGFTTSAVPNLAGQEATSLYVAGMKANTTYHMRATVTLSNGTSVPDIDHTFTTGALPAGIIPPMTVTTTPGLTPQPGIELIDTILGGTQSGAYATDLAGNVIWTYSPPDRQSNSLLYPIKLLPNGHMLMLIAPVSQQTARVPATTFNVLREIDLAGNIIQDLPMATLNARMQAAGYGSLPLQVYSHDVTLLPNGHILVIATMFKTFQDLPGYPGAKDVLGDVVIDLDQNMQPVWVWNSFDHFDVNRHPWNFPDWTHSNAVIYSKDDGNFLLSVRHQHWVVKVNYSDGKGDGSVLWKLGYQGDFALQGGTDPEDWFYAQHNPSFFSANTAGVFALGLMDNGDNRSFSDGGNCAAQYWRCYTTIPVMQIDETAKTATVIWRQTLPHAMYSSFAGDMFPLSNGNVEYNLAGVGPDAHIFEVTPEATPRDVWHMYIAGTNTYRASRIPSLYPGVQW